MMSDWLEVSSWHRARATLVVVRGGEGVWKGSAGREQGRS
jgi:hypothetical protein